MKTSDLRGDDIIDSRDVIARIKYLQEEVQGAIYEYNANERRDHEERDDFSYTDLMVDLDSDEFDEELSDSAFDDVNLEIEELLDLIKLQNSAKDYAGDWLHGCILIRKDHFWEYSKELCSDLGYVRADLPDLIVIDWEATARNLAIDYTEVEFSGESYLVR